MAERVGGPVVEPNGWACAWPQRNHGAGAQAYSRGWARRVEETIGDLTDVPVDALVDEYLCGWTCLRVIVGDERVVGSVGESMVFHVMGPMVAW
ncbi:hypothetical protein CYMTET_39976 [Cymbomonas tetramitiformis]|uniref:Uncharacterized protein n=1 Tax=Cymbomonas tetramitiformis TaxID=36881 RepID=A0AAE0F449_9CHLO|nr:hypothetical protein CYMTET_39976 [Cymbomonas tetramitiformis]